MDYTHGYMYTYYMNLITQDLYCKIITDNTLKRLINIFIIIRICSTIIKCHVNLF